MKLEEIANVKKSKLALQETIESLNNDIEKYLAETEEKRGFTLLLKANAKTQQTLTNLTNAQKKLEEELMLA